MFTSFGSSWVSRCGTVNCVRVDRVTVTVNICFFLSCSIADLGVGSLHPAPVMWQVWSFHMAQVFQVLKVLLLLQVPHIWQVLILLRTFTSIEFLSFKWNGSLYIYPWSTQLLTYRYSLINWSVHIMLLYPVWSLSSGSGLVQNTAALDFSFK